MIKTTSFMRLLLNTDGALGSLGVLAVLGAFGTLESIGHCG